MAKKIVTDTEPSDNNREPEQKRPDPFDLSRIKRAQNFHERTGVQKRVQVKVRKPAREWWFQSCPDEDYHVIVPVIEIKEANEIYFVDADLVDELDSEPCFGFRRLVLYQTRQGNCFFCPLRLPGPDGKLDTYSESLREYFSDTGRWQRVYANQQQAMYNQEFSAAVWDDPEWPTDSVAELLRTAFRGYVVNSMDHSLVQMLRGKQ